MKASVLRFSRAALRPCTSRHLVGRSYTSIESSPERKVAILGAAGGIGQPLALLMKLNPLQELLLMLATLILVLRSVTLDSYMLVAGYAREEQLGEALDGSDIVIIPAGVPRKPGMTRDDIFKISAGIVKSLSTAIAKYCPDALVNMISTPVNSTVPIAAEVFKKAGTFDEVNVPVVGGCAGITILPIFSQSIPHPSSVSI
ncbi:malate dehydrogenase [Salix suchowensis]|nr:malate dehydrogenase [Salix suchowensis]